MPLCKYSFYHDGLLNAFYVVKDKGSGNRVVIKADMPGPLEGMAVFKLKIGSVEAEIILKTDGEDVIEMLIEGPNGYPIPRFWRSSLDIMSTPYLCKISFEAEDRASFEFPTAYFSKAEIVELTDDPTSFKVQVG